MQCPIEGSSARSTTQPSRRLAATLKGAKPDSDCKVPRQPMRPSLAVTGFPAVGTFHARLAPARLIFKVPRPDELGQVRHGGLLHAVADRFPRRGTRNRSTALFRHGQAARRNARNESGRRRHHPGQAGRRGRCRSTAKPRACSRRPRLPACGDPARFVVGWVTRFGAGAGRHLPTSAGGMDDDDTQRGLSNAGRMERDGGNVAPTPVGL